LDDYVEEEIKVDDDASWDYSKNNQMHSGYEHVEDLK